MTKKFSAGAWVAVAAAVLAIVSFILYAVNVNAAGYYQGASVSAMPLTWAAVAALAVAVVLGMVEVKGAAGKAVEIVSGLLQIAAPAILAFCVITLISARAEGIGFIYFSNADVIKEVQTAANLSSASCAIASMVAYGVSMIVATVAAFFNLKKD